MDQRSFFRRWGVYVSCGIVLCIAVVEFVQIARAYDGTCGGLLTGPSGLHPCSFWDSMSFDLTFLVGIGGVVYGPILASVLLIPPLVGCLLDRRGRASVAQSILLFVALIFFAVPSVTGVVLGWRNAEVVVEWWTVELLCVALGATCMFVGSVLLDPAD